MITKWIKNQREEVMIITISGIKNGKENILKIHFNDKRIMFWIGAEEIILSDNCQNIIHQIYNYCDMENYKTFTQRTFFQAFKKFEKDTCIVNLIRTFAVSFPFVELNSTKKYFNLKFEEKSINSKPLKNSDDYFSDRILLDSDTNLKAQPQMYFLKKELTEKYSKEIMELFNSGSLQKYRVADNDEEKVFYYVPFVYEQPANKLELWNIILEDFDKAVKKQASNQWK